MNTPAGVSAVAREAQRGPDAEEATSALERAVRGIPRTPFLSFEDRYLQLMVGHSMPPPGTLRLMLEALAVEPDSRVLHVGAGAGYLTAVLSRMAREVCAVERLASMVDLAQRRFGGLGIRNVLVRQGNWMRGCPEEAPFDAILVSASTRDVPPALLDQLVVGGRLVASLGHGRGEHRLVQVVRAGFDEFLRRELGTVRFVSEAWDILVEMGVVDAALVGKAKEAAERSGHDVVEELRKLAQIKDSDICRALAQQHGMKYGQVDELLAQADVELYAHVPRPFVDHNCILPLNRSGDVVEVATSDPHASPADLSRLFPGVRVALHLVTQTDFSRLRSLLDLRLASHLEREETPVPEAEDLVASGEAPLETRCVALLEGILLDAVGERASDIHLERYGEDVRLRLRVDGELHDLPRYALNPNELVGVVNVVKVRAQLDITERRLPQGGRIRLRAAGAIFDLRVQTQPCLHGEHVIIRLLPRSVRLLSIEDLGFPPEIAGHYRRLLAHPAGLILVVGPTGSGKSTTLYAGLQVLATDSKRKVISVEDPIEYSIDGIQQTQVRPEVGFHFADAMRAFVREDPDVILVGEIRDGETALEALRASQTGHLVLSTLHCNDAIDAVQRQLDLGMHPNSIASELLCVIAQRLAKRVCDGCRREVAPEPAILDELFPAGAPSDFRCYAGQGCDRCGYKGTSGRIAVIEYLRFGASLRRAISRGLPLDDLRAIAVEAGLVTMRQSALGHVRNGVIPLAELPRIMTAERMAS